MASNLDAPELWRLTSPGGGAVPIKFLGLEGEFELENGSVTFRCLIPSNRLVEFLVETFPPPLIVGEIAVPQSATLPGLPGLVAKKVKFKNQDDSRPVDPFGFDPYAPPGTYHPVIEVTMEFGPRSNPDPDPTDPRTFLEISANNTGEFIQSTSPKARWRTETPNPSNLPDDEDPGSEVPPDTKTETQDPSKEPPVAGATESQKDPTVPMMVLVPHTEWTVKWNQVPYFYFYNNLVRRLRWCMGRVNSDSMPLLFGAVPETILFMGYNYTETYTWRDGDISTPPINVEMKFIEKRVVWNDRIIGHNHFWRPGKGWERLLIDGTNPVYALRDHNVIWDVS